MRKVLRSFESTCNGVYHTYKLIKDINEYRLESYLNGKFRDKLSWEFEAVTLQELEDLCEYIESRKYS